MAYKPDLQYTDLVHAGENITIDPKGVINSTGGGGIDPADMTAPISIFNGEGEDVLTVTGDGDIYADGTLYINGDTDVQELTPIYTSDIIGDYTNNTFTSSDTFEDLTEALETGHTLVARDTNGFVYVQMASEFDPESDAITYASVQPDGVYYLNWTGASRTISFNSFSGGGEIGEVINADGKTQAAVGTDVAAVLADGKTPVIQFADNLYFYSGTTGSGSTLRYTFSGTSYDYPTSTNDAEIVVGIIAMAIKPDSTSNVSSRKTDVTHYTSVYKAGDSCLFVRSNDNNYVWTHPTATDTVYRLTPSILSSRMQYFISSAGNRRNFPNNTDSIIYIENGNWHICYISEISGPDTGTTYPRTYKYRCVEPYSSNTITIYEVAINFTSSASYTVSATTNTYTIGS